MSIPGGTPMADPGWTEAARLGLTYQLNRSSNALVAIRALFTVMVLALSLVVLSALLLLGVAGLPGDIDLVAMSAVVVAVGGAAVVGTRVIRPPLSCESPEALIGGYRTRVLLGMAMSEVGVLVGFVGTILTASVLPVALGLFLTLIALGRVAPTSANIEQAQQELMESGCARSLQGVLLEPFTR